MDKIKNMTEQELEGLYSHERLAPVYIDADNNEVYVICFDCGLTDKITLQDLLSYAKHATNIPEKELIIEQLEEAVDIIKQRR